MLQANKTTSTNISTIEALAQAAHFSSEAFLKNKQQKIFSRTSQQHLNDLQRLSIYNLTFPL